MRKDDQILSGRDRVAETGLYQTMKKSSHYSILSVFVRIVKDLPGRWRIQLLLLFFGMLVAAVVETVNLGIIAIYVSCVSDPATFLHAKYTEIARSILPTGYLDTQRTVIISLSVVVVCVLMARNSLQASITYLGSRFAARVEAFYGSILLNGFLHAPYEWYQRQNSADLVIAVQWSAFFGRVFMDPFLRVMSDVVMVTFMLTALLIVRPFISIAVLMVLGGVALFLFVIMRKHVARVSGRCKEYNQSINKHVTKAIHGIKDVKVSGKEDFFLRDYQDDIYPLSRFIGLQQFLARSPVWVLEIVGFIMLTTSICVMSSLMEASTAEITATMALLAVTAYRVLPAVNKVLAGVTKMHTALPYLDNEFQYLDLIKENAQQEENQYSGEEDPFQFDREISFEDVSFVYEGGTQEALQGVKLIIKKGATVGVIGPSGAGKSTFVDMLIGLLLPSKGEIKIDGHDLKGAQRRGWVHSIGYVAQAPYIYDGTLAENVAFGCRGNEIDRERVLHCCKQAAMQDFLSDLNSGIDTSIGERGIRLSGGQQQRVVIARALYRRPSVMIFDEATSSLDTKSEKAIQETIYTFKGKQTLIIVAHRLSTVEDCDTLIWLEKGRVRKLGVPSEVLHEYQAAMREVTDDQ